MFYFASIQIPLQLPPLTMSSLRNTCFQNNMCTETTLEKFAISLVLVILCEPVSVETESGNFSALEAHRVYSKMAIKQASLFQYSCLRAYGHHRFD